MLTRDVEAKELRVERRHVVAVRVRARVAVARERCSAAGRLPVRAFARPVQQLQAVRLPFRTPAVRERAVDRGSGARRVDLELGCCACSACAEQETTCSGDGDPGADSGAQRLPSGSRIVDATGTAAESFHRQAPERPSPWNEGAADRPGQSYGPRLRNSSVAQVGSSAPGTTSAVGTPAVWCPVPSVPAANAGVADTRKPTAVTRPARMRYFGLTAFPLLARYQRRRNDRRFLLSAAL